MSKALSEGLLPQQHLKLVALHDSLDKIYCFLLKRKMTATVSKIQSIYTQLHPDSFDLELLFRSCVVLPDAYELRPHDTGGSEGAPLELEFVYRILAGPSNTHTKGRRKVLVDALSGAVYASYLEARQGEGGGGGGKQDKPVSIKQLNVDGVWPPTFDPEQCRLPEIRESAQLLALYSTYVRERQSHPPQQAAAPEEGGQETAYAAVDIEQSGGANAVLQRLRELPWYQNQIQHEELFAGRAAVFEDMSTPLPPMLLDRMQRVLGVTQLYRHQARAINALRQGKHAVVSTSTASGKSIIYNVPVLEAVLAEPQTTALYLFPTKALAQDQLRALLALTSDGMALPVRVAVCDGDTDHAERAELREETGANVVLTNPDMLHCTMLPDHRKWRRIYENLRFVVVDEAHLYRGAFGAHVAAVLRRLLRVCLLYGRCPQFVCCSATIANPAEHMRKLVPLEAIEAACKGSGSALAELEVIGAELDGAPQGDRLFVLWNPPLRQELLAGDSPQEQKKHQQEQEEQEQEQEEHDMSAEGGGRVGGVGVGASAGGHTGSPTKMSKTGSSTARSSSIAPPLSSPGRTRTVGPSPGLGVNAAGVAGVATGGPAGVAGADTSAGAGADTGAGVDVGVDSGLTPKKRRFLRACEEARPATMGPARDLSLSGRTYHDQEQKRRSGAGADLVGGAVAGVTGVVQGYTSTRMAVGRALGDRDPKWEVNYVGGWKRGRSSAEDMHISGRAAEAGAEGGEEGGDVNGLPPLHISKTAGLDGRGAEVHRLSSICETARLFTALVRMQLRTLAFCKSRKLVELVLGYSLKELETSAKHLMPAVASYRGGYTKAERRSIEQDLFSGRLLGVTTTCALELGIDVGALDATLHMGFPGSFASLWQQAGRAGRSGRPSVSIVVCFECPIDQHFAKNASELFRSPVEPAVLDVRNTHVLLAHLRCAAMEAPLNCSLRLPPARPATGATGATEAAGAGGAAEADQGAVGAVSGAQAGWGLGLGLESGSGGLVADADIWGREEYCAVLQYLAHNGQVEPAQQVGCARSKQAATTTPGDVLPTHWRMRPSEKTVTPRSMALDVSLRQIDPVTISVVVEGEEIDSLGYSRAFYELHEGAIFLHRAKQYLVTRLHLAACTAHLRPVRVKYYTSARNATTVHVLKQLEGEGCFHSGVVQVVSEVYGFVKKWISTGEEFEKVQCSLPPLEYETLAFWIDLPLRIKRRLEQQQLCPIAAMHAANHALVAMSPLFAQCDAADLGTEHVLSQSALEHPFRMMVFDQRCGGLGASNALFQHRHKVLREARRLIEQCGCKAGCPSCVLDPRCTHYNNCLSKRGAVLLLSLLLELLENESSVEVEEALRGGFCATSCASPAKAAGVGVGVGAGAGAGAAGGAAGSLYRAAWPGGNLGGRPTAGKVGGSRGASGGSGGSGGRGGSAGQRRNSMQRAVFRDGGDTGRRATKMAVSVSWTESVPDFVQGE